MSTPLKLFVQRGQRFGRLVVLRADQRTSWGARAALCRCDCGTEKVAAIKYLHAGVVRSCGCLQAETRMARANSPENRARLADAARVSAAARRTLSVEADQRFGRLTVIGEIPGRHRPVKCVCDCGVQTVVPIKKLHSGHTKSCGSHPPVITAEERAHRAERGRQTIDANRSAPVHGLHSHPLYLTWFGMIDRCENPEHISYKSYGGRGITVCVEWHDVTTFIRWVEANIGPRPGGDARTPGGRPLYSIDRVDVNGNYEPGNVRWATWPEQAANRRKRAGSLNELVDAPDTDMWCPTCGEQVKNEQAFDRHRRRAHGVLVPRS